MKLCLLALFLVALSLVYRAETHADSPADENETLRKELLALAEEDQSARKRMIQTIAQHGTVFDQQPDLDDPKIRLAIETMQQVDATNRARLVEIIERHGWPGKSLVGPDGSGAAWLLAQHADKNVAFQSECLEMMQAMPEGEVERQHIAMLTDRVLVNQGLEQVYGTQMDGAFKPRPIQDVEHVDARRASMGLPPLAEYVKQAKAAYREMSRQ